MFVKLILCLIFINYILCLNSTNNPEVKTTSGVIRGKSIELLNQTLNQFLGIPFAEPPIGKLRFSKPRPLEKPIEGVIDGTSIKNSCMQLPNDIFKGIHSLKLNISEDCLSLNIWSPEIPQNVSSKLKHVMFWIYGGGLTIGSIFQIPPYNGSILATHDVVFVSTNYRLGPFGLLYGGTDDAPGNLGFYDQLLALKWVRENIHMFGGDKNQITIFGWSAGSWSVSALVLSPLSRGLFQRAIMESGSIFHGKKRGPVTTSEATKQAKDMAKHFNCSDDQKWLDCLRGIDANKIINYTGISNRHLEGTEFLPISAQDAFKNHLYNTDIDLMAGVSRDEGSLLALRLPQVWGNITLKDFKDLVTYVDSIEHYIDQDKTLDFYLKNVDTNNSSALRKAFIDLFGDIMDRCPTYHFAKKFALNSQHKKTYFYELTYQGQFAQKIGCIEKTMGICHGSELEFVFGLFLNNPELSTQLDIDFSLEVMKMWTNFAKSGNPGSNWPQLIDHDSSVVKNLNPHELNGVLVDPFKSDCDGFWKDYYD